MEIEQAKKELNEKGFLDIETSEEIDYAVKKLCEFIELSNKN